MYIGHLSRGQKELQKGREFSQERHRDHYDLETGINVLIY